MHQPLSRACYIGAVLTALIHIAGEQLLLHPHRALYWHRMRWLVVSDLHLGKAAHLRKGGLALPEGSDERTLQRLDGLLAHFLPERLIILGDLFHSSHNMAWAPFAAWCGQQHCAIHLVPGNHDVLADRRYAEAGIQLCDESVEEGPFVFTHDGTAKLGGYVLGGHVHPGVLLRGLGRQRLRMPCFWFGARNGLLPAFGMGTGLHLIEPLPGERVHACTDQAVLDVSGALAGHSPQRRTK
jgi:DNA ligase-associated metallophosphoesterase